MYAEMMFDCHCNKMAAKCLTNKGQKNKTHLVKAENLKTQEMAGAPRGEKSNLR